MNKTLEKFKEHQWGQIWAGGWSLLTCSEFGELYTRSLKVNGKPFCSLVIFNLANGKSACLLPQDEQSEFGQHLADEVIAKPERAEGVANELRAQADKAIEFMMTHINAESEVTPELYREFWQHILNYYKPHVNLKYIVDYLPADILEQHLSMLEKARVHAEPVFEHSEEFMELMAEQVSEKTGIEPELILSMLRDELIAYIDTGELPDQKVLEERYKRSALLVDTEGALLQVGSAVDEVEAIIHGSTDTDELKGKTAYGGKVTGVVRVIMDPEADNEFNEGDILVTGMTRPEYMHLINKSAAFVTDAGGVLSHAAITAREVKKPCVIGTQVATKVLKDGYEIEVDADNGTVKILNKT